jgi:hypothetical protein
MHLRILLQMEARLLSLVVLVRLAVVAVARDSLFKMPDSSSSPTNRYPCPGNSAVGLKGIEPAGEVVCRWT